MEYQVIRTIHVNNYVWKLTNRLDRNKELLHEKTVRVNSKSRAMDTIDSQIVRALYMNGRATQEQIARQVCLSRPAIHERIKRLEASGIIGGYKAQVDWRRTEQSLTTFIWIRTSGGKLQELADAVMQLSNSDTFVEECHLVTGEWCLLLKARTVSTTTLQHLLNRLREMPRIRNTMTTVVLSSAGETALTEERVSPAE